VVSLPLQGKVDSLNVSVSTGILLYEAVRQRAVAGPAQAGTAPAEAPAEAVAGAAEVAEAEEAAAGSAPDGAPVESDEAPPSGEIAS